ncbi:hypothetical protein [Sphingomonas sp.]|uniref:hypothetical protein n=1 Tax=Sphingomonas sp. TaxID=28214 RepID=UPI0031D49095
MDLNELFYRHQTSLLCAENASCAEARIVHEGLAELYAGRIRDLRRKSPDSAPLVLGVQQAG